MNVAKTTVKLQAVKFNSDAIGSLDPDTMNLEQTSRMLELCVSLSAAEVRTLSHDQYTSLKRTIGGLRARYVQLCPDSRRD